MIQKILTPCLAKMYQASSCKPFTLSATRDEDDDDDDQDDRPNRHLLQHMNAGGGGQAPHIQPPPPISPPPPPHPGGQGGAQLFNLPPPQPPALPPQALPNLQHLPRLPPQATQGASEAGAHHNVRTRSCSPSRPSSSLSKQSSRSRSQSVASTTNAVDLEWDFYEYRQGGDKEGQYDRFPDPPEAGSSMERQGHKYQIPRHLPHAGATQHQQPDNDEDEEGIEFFDANVSLSPHLGAQGAQSGSKSIIRISNTGTLGPPLVARAEDGQPLSPAPGLPASPQGAVGPGPSHSDQHLGQLGQLGQPGQIGDQPLDQLGTLPSKTPLQHKTLQFPPHFYGDESPKVQDLGLPRLPVAPHGHQVFDNCEMGSPAPSRKKKRPSVLSNHLQDTRPLSSRKTAKAAAERISATSKKSTRKSTKTES